MQVGQFPASAANSLIEGYCDDFVSLAAILAQTLEQVAMRGIGFDASRPSLQRIENGMRELASAIHELLERGSVSTRFESVLARSSGEQPAAVPAPPPAEPTPPQQPRGLTGSNTMGQGPMPPRLGGAHTPAPTSKNLRGGTPTPRPQPTTTPPSPAAPPQPATRQATPPPSPSRPPTTQVRGVGPAPTTPPRTEPPQPRQGQEPPAAQPPERRATKPEGLRGTNRTMPLQSVFQFLGRMRKSGTLHVFVADEILAFEFVNGCIEFTATNRCPMSERLGELLVELGFCTHDSLAPILAKVGVSSANRLGQLVVDSKLVSNGQVLEALEAQVLRRFQRVCECGEASYEFETGRRLPGDGRIRIAPFELTIDQPWKLRTP